MRNKFHIYIRLCLVLTILFPVLSFAQTESQPKLIGIGIKSGATYSNLIFGIPIQEIKSSFIPSYGLIFSYIDKKTVGIQIEINYLTKSWEENPIADYIFEATLNYIEIPMLTTLHFGNRFKFLVNFGPHLSILLNEDSSHNIAQESDIYPIYKERIPRNADFGMTGGAGFRLQTKIGLFQTEARYTYGFQNLYDSKKSNLDSNNMQTISVSVSYQFLFTNSR